MRRVPAALAVLALGAGTAAAVTGGSAGAQEPVPSTPSTATTTPPVTTTTTPSTTTPAPVPQPPAASTGGATAITSTSATLAASVTPRGQRTSAVFDDGTSTAYGSTSPQVDAGDSTTAQPLAAPITGLRASTTYHYRVRARNATGEVLGADRTFRTAAAPAAAQPPALSNAAVASTSDTGAVLRARITPRGRATSVTVQYGPTTGLGSVSAPVDAGAGTSARTIAVPIAGLAPATTYRARIVATSAGGTTRSGLLRLTTRTPNAITVTAEPARITFGQAARLSGRVTGSRAGGVAVTVSRATSPFLAFTALTTATTSSSGTYALDVRPVQRTRYEVAAQAPGAPAAVRARSRSVLVSPRVGFGARRLADGRVRLSGRIVPRGSARVSLRRVRDDGRLVVVAGTDARPAGTGSSYRLTRRLRAGRYLVRVLPSAGRGLASGDSRTIALAGPRR